MKLLLDTHVWLRWLVPSGQPLADPAVRLIESAQSLAVSAVSCWEVAYLAKRGRISMNLPLQDWLSEALAGSGVVSLPVTTEIAARAALLGDVHRDPADRFIVATAIEADHQLLTLDAFIHAYPELEGRLAK